MKHSKYLSKFLDKEVALYHKDRRVECYGILRELNKKYVIIETDKNTWKELEKEVEHKPIPCLRLMVWHQIDFIDSEEIK